MLLALAFQSLLDFRSFSEEDPAGAEFITLNKKVEGGVLQNLARSDEFFDAEEIARIEELPGVAAVGGFSRNHFPVTIHVWPAGKVGLGTAARADLFFESIPDEFLDQMPGGWQWEQNASFVPIMVPKFYLDLWNFGLAPSRPEYPALSEQAASSMPIEIFIGRDQSVRMPGRFVAFSKRINSVLAPPSFLEWANRRYGADRQEEFFFLWRNGEIQGPPVTREELLETLSSQEREIHEASPLAEPEKRLPVEKIISRPAADRGPSRLIVKLSGSPSEEFLSGLENLGCETNRELPQEDWIRKAGHVLSACLGAMGLLLSLLSISIFANNFRLVIAQSEEAARTLLGLGFPEEEIASVFGRRFLAIVLPILLLSLALCLLLKRILAEKLLQYGISWPEGLTGPTWVLFFAYGTLVIGATLMVIRKSVRSLS